MTNRRDFLKKAGLGTVAAAGASTLAAPAVLGQAPITFDSTDVYRFMKHSAYYSIHQYSPNGAQRTTPYYGGTNTQDSSGTLKYVRVWKARAARPPLQCPRWHPPSSYGSCSPS